MITVGPKRDDSLNQAQIWIDEDGRLKQHEALNKHLRRTRNVERYSDELTFNAEGIKEALANFAEYDKKKRDALYSRSRQVLEESSSKENPLTPEQEAEIKFKNEYKTHLVKMLHVNKVKGHEYHYTAVVESFTQFLLDNADFIASNQAIHTEVQTSLKEYVQKKYTSDIFVLLIKLKRCNIVSAEWLKNVLKEKVNTDKGKNRTQSGIVKCLNDIDLQDFSDELNELVEQAILTKADIAFCAAEVIKRLREKTIDESSMALFLHVRKNLEALLTNNLIDYKDIKHALVKMNVALVEQCVSKRSLNASTNLLSEQGFFDIKVFAMMSELLDFDEPNTEIANRLDYLQACVEALDKKKLSDDPNLDQEMKKQFSHHALVVLVAQVRLLNIPSFEDDQIEIRFSSYAQEVKTLLATKEVELTTKALQFNERKASIKTLQTLVSKEVDQTKKLRKKTELIQKIIKALRRFKNAFFKKDMHNLSEKYEILITQLEAFGVDAQALKAQNKCPTSLAYLLLTYRIVAMNAQGGELGITTAEIEELISEYLTASPEDAHYLHELIQAGNMLTYFQAEFGFDSSNAELSGILTLGAKEINFLNSIIRPSVNA